MFEQLTSGYAKYDPFRTPDWRWKRVMQLAGSKPRGAKCGHNDGKRIKVGRDFIMAYTNLPDRRHDLFLSNSGLYYAYEIYKSAEDDPAKSLAIEAALLARMTFEEIARLCKTMPSAIKWYAAMFFDVSRDLDSRWWINQEVLLPAMMRNMGGIGDSFKQAVGRFPFVDSVIAKPFMDASLKYFAYHGGPIVLDYLLTGCTSDKRVNNADDLSKFFDSHWSLAARARSAQAVRTFEINKYNVMELFQLHAQIIALEKGEDGKSTQQTTIERHISGILDQLPWTVGRNERTQKFQSSPVATYEAGAAAELRDDEIMFASARTPLPQGLEDAMQIKLPPPRRKKQQQEKPDDQPAKK